MDSMNEHNAKKIKMVVGALKVKTVKDAMETCGVRVTQTHTAKVIKPAKILTWTKRFES